MFRWILAGLAALGLLGSKPTVAPSNDSAKSTQPSTTAPNPTTQETRTDGQPTPP